MQEINTVWVGTIKAGEHDIDGLRAIESLSQVNEDGSIYFYDFTSWNLDEIMPAIETAFAKDADDWTITLTRKGPAARVYFD